MVFFSPFFVVLWVTIALDSANVRSPTKPSFVKKKIWTKHIDIQHIDQRMSAQHIDLQQPYQSMEGATRAHNIMSNAFRQHMRM